MSERERSRARDVLTGSEQIISRYIYARVRSISKLRQKAKNVPLKAVKDYTIYQKQGIYLTFLDQCNKEKMPNP